MFVSKPADTRDRNVVLSGCSGIGEYCFRGKSLFIWLIAAAEALYCLGCHDHSLLDGILAYRRRRIDAATILWLSSLLAWLSRSRLRLLSAADDTHGFIY